MLTVLNGGGASTCTVNGLLKYQSYEFFIVPFYKTVEGKPSNSRIARTLEDGKWDFHYVLQNTFSLLSIVLIKIPLAWKNLGLSAKLYMCAFFLHSTFTVFTHKI